MMQNKAPPEGSVAEQADYWVALLNSPLADEQQKGAFQQWLAESSEHRAAYQKAQTFWRQLDGLHPSQIERLEQAVDEATASRGQFEPVVQRSALWRSVKTFSAAGCLLLFCYFGFAEWPHYFADYRTATGGLATAKLDDGTIIVLNTDTALSVDFSAQRRTVRLYEGEAYFSVAADPQRPFEVVTDSGRVQALGTQFDIKTLADALTVTVFQHAVRVAFNQGETIDRLAEGERVRYENQAALPVEKANLKQVGGWRERKLIFINQPLSQVVAELDRYRRGKIVILNQDVAQHQVTGVFDPRDTEAALSAIETTLKIKQYRVTDRLVFLTR